MEKSIVTEEVLERIKKLYDKALSTQQLGNLEEANTFFAKVNELCLLHQVEIEELKDFEISSKSTIIQSGFDGGITFGYKVNEGLWETKLIIVLCNHNFCKPIFKMYRWVPEEKWRKEKGIEGVYPRATIIGTRSNIEIVKYFFSIVRNIFVKLAGEAYTKLVEEKREIYYVFDTNSESAAEQFQENFRELKYEGVGPKDVMPSSYSENMLGKSQKYYLKNLIKFYLIPERGVYIRSFLLGAVEGLDTRMWSERNKLQKENEEKGDKVTALMRITFKEIDKFVETNFENLGNLGSSSPGSRSGYNEGYNTGRNTPISKGINGSISTTKHLK